jgi:hypothetical protein
MRDVDDVMAHESKQQKFVEEIINKINQDTRDDEHYLDLYYTLAECILEMLRGDLLANRSKIDLYMSYVHIPVHNFSKHEAERRYLRLKVLEKLIGYISARIMGEYTRADLAGEIHAEPA